MPLPTRDVVGILADNLRIRGSVLPIPARQATRWARDLDLPRGGETVLYTGLMYQLIPYIERLVALERLLGNSPLARLTGVGRRLNRFINGVAFVARPSASERAEYDRVPANVARLLQRAGVQFGYMYEDDLYAGALAHDLGADEVVALHARRVVALLRKHGVREVITIDPHTTNMLRSVYPTLIKDYDLRVRSYLEVLAERGLPFESPLTGKVVVHDPCVYARYENMIEPPRKLLAEAGLEVAEPQNSGLLTWCCGGPVEALYPAKAAALAAVRVAQLREVAPDCLTMCPICLVNLRKSADGMRFRDISEYLIEASAPPPETCPTGQPDPAPGLSGR
ncbi:MAG: (Fe-S)-binding protein [Candidatus Limnocylindrales bacterium]|jgi:Fe-S oxidoreductase